MRNERVFLAAPVEIGGPTPGSGVLVVSRSLEPYEETRTEIIIGLVLLGLLVTAGATGIAAWTVGRTLTPVEDMAALADEWSERALDARFDDPDTGDEIAPPGTHAQRPAGPRRRVPCAANSCSPPSWPTSCARR